MGSPRYCSACCAQLGGRSCFFCNPRPERGLREPEREVKADLERDAGQSTAALIARNKNLS